MSIVGRKPKLSAAQQLEVVRWANRRDQLRRELREMGSAPIKAHEMGVSVSTLNAYIYGQQKCPVRA